MSNEIELQKHEDKLEINRILTISSDYDGYDFEEEMAEVLRDLL